MPPLLVAPLLGILDTSTKLSYWWVVEPHSLIPCSAEAPSLPKHSFSSTTSEDCSTRSCASCELVITADNSTGGEGGGGG